MTPAARGENSHDEESWVEKFRGFPSRGGTSTLRSKNMLGSSPQISPLLLRELGALRLGRLCTEGSTDIIVYTHIHVCMYTIYYTIL